MSMPPDQDVVVGTSSVTAQVLMSLGKIETQLAVLDTKVDSLTRADSDHESRLRLLEAEASQATGVRDLWARFYAVLAVGVAAAATAADWIHH